MASPQPHFGQWFRRVREKLGLTQRKMAQALGLKAYITIRDVEQRADRSMRGTTAEAVLDLFGYSNEEQMDRAWRAGEMPDIGVIRHRLAEAQSIAEAMKAGSLPEVEFDAVLVGDVFRWISAHPNHQQLDLLRNVTFKDASRVMAALIARLAQVSERLSGKDE